MADYVYLLEHRLSADQRSALGHLRDVAREAGTILFLTGDAVRDLTSGHAVRELEVSIHGNTLKLKKQLEKTGAKVWGEDEPSRTLYLCFPRSARVNLISTHNLEYPKPGKPVYHWASIQEDLRRRDFTVNSMAISLNEGSYGLLMDPLNGAADIEARILRLVSNYGFIEDPALMIRVTRYRARLGWEMDTRTQTRYDNAKSEGMIEALSDHGRRQELEQIGHEEDGLKVLRALDAEGWMKVLFPAWTAAKADEPKLTALHDLAVSLTMQDVHPDLSAGQMQLLTAKLAPKDLSALKKELLRPGFVAEWNTLESRAAAFSKVLLAKQNVKPSAGYKLFMSYDPEAVLWLGFSTKSKEVQDRYHLFLKVWPEARQRIPYVLMLEMRITPELPGFTELVQNIFLELIDGKLTTPEEMRAYLEPHSPPAPPPQVTIKRTRARRAEAKLKQRELDEEEDEDALPGDDDLDEAGGDDEELDLGALPPGEIAREEEEEESEEDEDLDDEDDKPARGKKKSAPPKPASVKSAPTNKDPKPVAAKPEKSTPAKSAPAPKPVAMKAAPVTPAKTGPPKPEVPKPSPAAKGKPAPAPAAKAAVKEAPKPPAKPAAKVAPRPPAKKLAKPAPTKSARPAPKPAKPAKPAPKKSAKPAKKR
jgi:tRNA nucleotidyltransferase/poly(A) polymerase